jgi:hypothetical protein
MSLSKKPKRPDTPLAPTPVVRWANSVKNPENKEFVAEVAFNKKKRADRNITKRDLSKVTQEEFNKRYGVEKDSTAYLPIKK